MCGFAGYIHNYGTFDKEEVIHKMADRIKHRGPDDAHYYIDDGIALGFRRLSIIDLEGGRQPILNEDGSLVLLFNGEIYNYKALHAELTARGHTFATDSDTEVLLHGYEAWGGDLPKHLRGMFAFALWDRTAETLFCARDLFGIKPLYYYKKGDVLFIIESMKLMNEVQSDFDGVVEKILVSDGQAVEYDQPVMIIK